MKAPASVARARSKRKRTIGAVNILMRGEAAQEGSSPMASTETVETVGAVNPMPRGEAALEGGQPMVTNETVDTVAAVNPTTRGEAAQEGEYFMGGTKQVFEVTWRAKWLADGAKTIEQMAEALEVEAAHLRELAAAGVELADVVEDDYAFLTTTDPEVATKYEFEQVEQEEEEGAVTVVGVAPIDKLGTGLAADLVAILAVDGKVGILGHAESTEFVRPDVAERFIQAARKAV
jgi:hypothetical protein